VCDVVALTGASVDTVPGVPGIGLKTGAKLLEQFGDLETLLANASRVAGAKKQHSLVEHADRVRLGRTRIPLKDDVPLDLDWEALKLTPSHTKTLKALCQECGFHR